MSDPSSTPAVQRSIWLRCVLMILMAMIFHFCGTLLFLLAVIQFVITLLSGAANARLNSFGHALGRYLGQLADFLSFAAEELPFPFSDWPDAGGRGTP